MQDAEQKEQDEDKEVGTKSCKRIKRTSFVKQKIKK